MVGKSTFQKMVRNRICHKEYATVISREGRNRESGRRRSLCEATASILEQNGVSVAEDGISSCASILEEKGALTRSYSLYFRGEGSLQTELLPLF